MGHDADCDSASCSNKMMQMLRRVFTTALVLLVVSPVSSALAFGGPADTQTFVTQSVALPAKSGEGRRVVYSITRQRVWVVNKRGEVVRTFLVSGRRDRPLKGTYRVFSQSPESFSPLEPGVTFRYMTRFAKGLNGINIGFHEIPRKNGKPMQTVGQLGTPLGSGCLRSSTEDAMFIYRWAKPGTQVVVVY
jgi:lipoprotein-anchoring transpeptidase ErfK/SrfK